MESAVPSLHGLWGHHLVGICMRVEKLDTSGQLKETSHYCYTTTPIMLGEEWYLATAGHCLENLQRVARHPQMRLKDQVLVDYNGIGAKVRLPTPFKGVGSASVPCS
jgi:hypothetical protein